MIRLSITSRVGADGVLAVNVPIGAADANREVTVTIEPIVGNPLQPGDYQAWLQRLAGQWQGEFERPPQEPLEEREPLP